MQKRLQNIAWVLVAVGVIIPLSNEPAKPACSESITQWECENWSVSDVGRNQYYPGGGITPPYWQCEVAECVWQPDPVQFGAGACIPDMQGEQECSLSSVPHPLHHIKGKGPLILADPTEHPTIKEPTETKESKAVRGK